VERVGGKDGFARSQTNHVLHGDPAGSPVLNKPH
jgi:hypothetical protein